MNQVNLFLESIKSEETRRKYSLYLTKYFEFAGNPKQPKQIESKIIDFIIHLKQQGISYYAISNYIAPVKTYYIINDVLLNSRKIDRFLPENRRKRQDRAYTHSEISKILEIADERMRVVILLLASTGIRIGAVQFIRLGNLQDRKLIVYENSNEEYFTFITPECKKAIDNYLDMRARYGEKLDDNSYLVREQFDVRCLSKSIEKQSNPFEDRLQLVSIPTRAAEKSKKSRKRGKLDAIKTNCITILTLI